jgi:hypothetical protein
VAKVSHRDAPPETPVQQAVREFYTARWQSTGKECGWGRDKHGQFFSEFARDAEAAWTAAVTSALNPSA